MDPKAVYQSVLTEVKKQIVGNESTIELMFVAMVANGHVLLEGVPGIAKTTMTKTLADAITADFKRIQGTPDLDVKDIIGYTYIDENRDIKLKNGPIFTNILLIDELNRAPPKTTTALLEPLEERQVTIGDNVIPLKKPFITFATQNPLNIEGTSALPKVVADRFLMRIGVTYPSPEDERSMLRIKEHEDEIKIQKVIGAEQIIELQKQAKKVTISDDVIKYITDLVNATRTDIHVIMGGSPRAEISFMECGKAKTLIEGRNEVTRDDIKFLAKPVLAHRLLVRTTGGIGVGGIIEGIIASMR